MQQGRAAHGGPASYGGDGCWLSGGVSGSRHRPPRHVAAKLEGPNRDVGSDDHGVEIDEHVGNVFVPGLPLAHDARARLGVVGDGRRANPDARVTKEDAVAVPRVAETPRAPRVAALAMHPHYTTPVRDIDGCQP